MPYSVAMQVYVTHSIQSRHIVRLKMQCTLHISCITQIHTLSIIYDYCERIWRQNYSEGTASVKSEHADLLPHIQALCVHDLLSLFVSKYPNQYTPRYNPTFSMLYRMLYVLQTMEIIIGSIFRLYTFVSRSDIILIASSIQNGSSPDTYCVSLYIANQEYCTRGFTFVRIETPLPHSYQIPKLIRMG